MRPLTRIPPTLPVTGMKTYTAATPLATHWREATCTEHDCEAQRTGWLTIIDERHTRDVGAADTPAGSVELLEAMSDQSQRQAYYIRHLSGRAFVESVDEGTGHTIFDFGPGQTCFERHVIKTDRPEIYVVRGGDWRGNPRQEGMTHASAADWVEDFSEHQDRIANRVNRG